MSELLERRTEVTCVDCGQRRFVRRGHGGERCHSCAGKHSAGKQQRHGPLPGSASPDQLETWAQNARDQMFDRHGQTEWWTRERIIAAIQAWAKRTGSPPSHRSWTKKQGQGLGTPLAEEWKPGPRPNAATVTKTFGTWNAAIKAAGFEPRREGVPRGYSFTYTPDQRAAKSRASRFNAHNRWHVQRDIVNPECEYCLEEN